MNIKALLEYQSLEKELQDINAGIEKKLNGDLKIGEQIRSLKSKINTIARINAEVENILNICESYKNDIDIISTKFSELTDNGEDAFDDLEYALEDIEHINKQIMQLSYSIEGLNKYERLYDNVVNFKKEHDITKEAAKEESEKYKNSATERDARLKKLKELLMPRETKLQNIKNTIVEKDFEMYLKAKEVARSYPYICEYVDNRCSGCSLSDASLAKVLKRPGDIAICPECQRLLYVPEG